jgi:hypothetical protein
VVERAVWGDAVVQAVDSFGRRSRRRPSACWWLAAACISSISRPTPAPASPLLSFFLSSTAGRIRGTATLKPDKE